MKKSYILTCLFLLILLLPAAVSAADPAPTVISINPAFGINTGTVSITNMSGTGFNTTVTPTVMLIMSGQTNIQATSVTVVSATQITCTFDLTGKTAGLWNVAVTNPDGQQGTLSSGFMIKNPAPTITSVLPGSGYNTSSVSNVVISGTGFLTSGATVVLAESGQANVTGTIVSATATQLTCTFPITGIQAGSWDVIVTNVDGQSATRSGGFTILSPTNAVTLSSITPSSALANTTVSITSLAGTNFQSSASLRLRRAGYNDIYGTVSTLSSTAITGTFNLTSQVPGDYQVCVINPNADAVCGLTFTIDSDQITNGSIYFETNPPGASVYVNNTYKGITPFTLSNVIPSYYKVLVEDSGYQIYTETVKVNSGTKTSFYAKLVSSETAEVTTVPATTVTTVATTKKSTVKTPTPWPTETPTPASPLGTPAIIGAVGLAFLALRKR